MRHAKDHEDVPNYDIFPITDETTRGGESQNVPASQVAHSHQIRAQEKTRQVARMRRLWLACLFSLLYLVAIAVFYSQSLVGRPILIAVVLVVCIAMVLFYGIFASGLNQRVQEKTLTAPIASCALATMLWIVYCAPATRIIFAPFVSVTIAYGMYRLSQRTMLLLCVGTLAGYALVVGLHYMKARDEALLQLELLHWFVLALALPPFVVLTGRVQRLHGALHKAGMKIQDIEENARRDPLTDCYNRRYMVAALEEQKRFADATGAPLCLAVIDLDHFKRINDEVGHLAGDEVLRTFARVAQDNIRQADIFGRYGGEEFLLVLPETSLLAALNTAERIREQIENYEWSEKLQGLVTVSIGLTQYAAGESVLDLFSRTDTAMYLAKRGGRNQVVVEEPSTQLWQTAPET
jgi:diguanylate cyclase (GGDEF)-like protein